jgi:predicted RNase H-like HicB family nuclease
MQTYYALVHQDGDSAFGISFPDVPHCFSAADDEDAVMRNAQEALALYIGDLTELPAARSLHELRLDSEVRADLEAGAFIIAVPLIVLDHKARFNLMLDTALVAGVDDIAKAIGVSRSEFISQTVRTRLETDVGAIVLKKTSDGGGNFEKNVRFVPAAAAARVPADPAASKVAKKAAASALTQKSKAKAKAKKK